MGLCCFEVNSDMLGWYIYIELKWEPQTGNPKNIVGIYYYSGNIKPGWVYSYYIVGVPFGGGVPF